MLSITFRPLCLEPFEEHKLGAVVEAESGEVENDGDGDVDLEDQKERMKKPLESSSP